MRSDEELLARYLDGELETSEAEDLGRRLREDPALRAELGRLERIDDLAGGLGVPPPEPDAELTRRVMARIGESGIPSPRRPNRRTLFQPMSIGPLAMAATLLLFLGFMAGRWSPSPAPPEETPTVRDDREEKPRGVAVHFILAAAGAQSVSVVGTFNGWEPEATPMTQVKGRWIARLRLPPGRHEYQFVLDGERWIVDPAAPTTVEDGFGGTNGVVEI